uniref:Uncharacterized protein n=1 Tax=Nelumbo nucifera TaxID=4432 RepID=A0A822Y9B2_NELNU|nr:TPA_asm: hypothetical protein HUJ06_030588 [Nelumbo nucifera]
MNTSGNSSRERIEKLSADRYADPRETLGHEWIEKLFSVLTTLVDAVEVVHVQTQVVLRQAWIEKLIGCRGLFMKLFSVLVTQQATLF